MPGRKALNGSQEFSHLLGGGKRDRSGFMFGEGLSRRQNGLAGPQGIERTRQDSLTLTVTISGDSAPHPSPGELTNSWFSLCYSPYVSISPYHLPKTQPISLPKPGFLCFCLNLEPETWES